MPFFNSLSKAKKIGTAAGRGAKALKKGFGAAATKDNAKRIVEIMDKAKAGAYKK